MVKNQGVRNVFVFMFETGKYFKFSISIWIIKFCTIWQSSKKSRMKIHDIFQLWRVKLRKMMDGSYVKIWDKKTEQEQGLAPGSTDRSSILLTHSAWTGALCCVVGFVHVHSSHMQSSSAELKLWVEMLIWDLGNHRQLAWDIYLKWPKSSHEGQALLNFAVPMAKDLINDCAVKTFCKKGSVFLNDARYAGDVARTLENSLCLNPASRSPN